MPTVPTYPVGGSVQQQSLPAVRSGLNTPFEAFGGGGEGLVSAGQGLMKFSDRVDEIVERDNKVAAKNAFLKLADDANLLDRDLMSRRLSSAGTVYDDGKMQMKALMDKRGSELKNPRQRELFDALAQSRYDSYLQRWNNHQQEQMDKADVLSSKAMVADAVSTAIKDYTNPQAITEARTKIEIGVATSLKGADAETIRVATEAEISKLHRGIADAMASNGNAVGAMAYVKAHRNELQADDLTSLQKSLRDEADTQSAQSISDQAFAKFGTDTAAAAEWISKNTSGGVESKALSSYSTRVTMQEHADTKRREQNAASGAIAILQSTNAVEAEKIANAEKDEQTRLSLLKLARDVFPSEKPKTEFNPANVAGASFLRGAIDRFKESGQAIQIGDKSYPLDNPGSVALAASALGLDNENRKDVLKYFETGGLVGNLKEANVKGVFESLTDKKIEDRPQQYQYVLDYVKRWAPEGKETDADTLRKLTSQALLNFKSSKELSGSGELLGWNGKGTNNSVSRPYWAKELGVSESALVQKIQADGGKVSPDSVDLYTRTWFMPQEARAQAIRILNENKAPVTEANIRTVWLKYGDTF